MTREIIFRGKRIDTGEWVEGYYIFEDESAYIYPETGRCPEVYPETLGQYTGLKDTNGNRIFEGDIVKAWQWTHDDDFELIKDLSKYDIALVKWEPEMSGWGVESGLKNSGSDILSYLSQTEIIGNIHDNPELMEAES